MDQIDYRILRHLQRDGRVSNSDLASAIGLSESPCLRRVRNLEKSGVIEGYGARIDRRRIELGLTVFVGVKVERHGDAQATRFETWATEQPQILSCHLVSGEYDFLMEVVAGSIADYEDFLTTYLWAAPDVRDIRSTFVIRTAKSGTPLPIL